MCSRRKFPIGVFAEGRNFTLYNHHQAISWQTGSNISPYSNKNDIVANRAVQQREMNLFFELSAGDHVGLRLVWDTLLN